MKRQYGGLFYIIQIMDSLSIRIQVSVYNKRLRRNASDILSNFKKKGGKFRGLLKINTY